MNLQRSSGIALWRQIADEIRSGLRGGLADENGKLPSESALADTFGVNRHTVRAALANLAKERVVESRRGSGTFVLRSDRISYSIGRRTRFSSGVGSQADSASLTMLGYCDCVAPKYVAEKLEQIGDGKVLEVETLSYADGQPLSVSTHWFDFNRFSGLPSVLERSGSITQALKSCGVTDYIRVETVIEATHGSESDLERLKLAPGALILATKAVNADPDGRPIQYSESKFAADRVSLTVDHG